MSNIIHADIYRIFRSAALRNTIIGIIATVVLIGGITAFETSDGLNIMLDSAAQQMASADLAEMKSDLEDMKNYFPQNAADFVRDTTADPALLFFLLPLIITVFCADFSHGTYRNTISYESSRTKVYISKLLLSVGFCLLLELIALCSGWLVGVLLFGFSGFSAQYFVRLAVVLLLLLPTQLGLIGLGHCIVAFTKKSSSTIAIFLIGLTVISIALQSLAMFPELGWLSLLDWNSTGKLLATYWNMPAASIAFIVCTQLIIASVTTVLGVSRYRGSDLS